MLGKLELMGAIGVRYTKVLQGVCDRKGGASTRP